MTISMKYCMSLLLFAFLSNSTFVSAEENEKNTAKKVSPALYVANSLAVGVSFITTLGSLAVTGMLVHEAWKNPTKKRDREQALFIALGLGSLFTSSYATRKFFKAARK